MKSKVIDHRCIMTGKKAYYQKKAEGVASTLKPDERGPWSAYKCPYGETHWHIGHTPSVTKVSEPNHSGDAHSKEIE